MEEEERVDKFQFACADIEDGDRTGGVRVGFGGGVPDAPDTPTPPPKRSVRIAEEAIKSPSKTQQTTLRVNEARCKAKIKSHSIHGMNDEGTGNKPYKEMGTLTYEEKKFLLAVERGDVASVRRMLASPEITSGVLNINCCDPLGRSALLMAIDNENLEMVELLLDNKMETKDALLHAINEEFVEAVEVLLDHEETIHKPGELHSWEAIPPDTANFTPDITPLVLGAHRDNYEIIKILLDRGAILPMPHDVRCGCDECMTSRSEDSLRHSRSRINAYRALASPSLIALSSKDPILTAFELSWELRRLSFAEHEFKSEYLELRGQCTKFATSLLDHTRSSTELEILLNHDPTGPVYQHGDRMHLNRLKLAIKYRQKKFVAHPNVQQLLASIWYEGLPGFRQMNMILQGLEVCRIGLLFPFFSLAYIICPWLSYSQKLRKPFIKFICTSASYFTFLFLLILASQRIEVVIAEWFQNEKLKEWLSHDVTVKRGSTPTMVEWAILAWVAGLIWSEIKQLWDVGLHDYIADMWNVVDFVTNSLYVATVALRLVAWHKVQNELAIGSPTAHLPREHWDTWDPMLISEGTIYIFGQ
jgi:transient receptor potential cation channel subfamily C